MKNIELFIPEHLKIKDHPPYKFPNKSLGPDDCKSCNGVGKVWPWGTDHEEDCVDCKGTEK